MKVFSCVFSLLVGLAAIVPLSSVESHGDTGDTNHKTLVNEGWLLQPNKTVGDLSDYPNHDFAAFADGRLYIRPSNNSIDGKVVDFAGHSGQYQLPDGLSSTKRLILSVMLGQRDNRVVVNNQSTLTSYPFRTIGSLSSENGRTGCTATLVGPRHAITAAHCLHDGSEWRWPWFNPGQQGDSDLNGGKLKAVAVYGRTFGLEWDYGLVILPDNKKLASLGWMGMQWLPLSDYKGERVQLAGFPLYNQECNNSPRSDDKCGGYMYRDQCNIQRATDGYLMYDCDATGGQSGSAIFRHRGEIPVVFGVHKRGNEKSSGAVETSDPPTLNLGPRMRQRMYDDICTWIGKHPSRYADHQCY